MSLLDLAAQPRDQKTAATLLKSPLSLSLTCLISQFLVNLITLVPVDTAGNFYANHVYV